MKCSGWPSSAHQIQTEKKKWKWNYFESIFGFLFLISAEIRFKYLWNLILCFSFHLSIRNKLFISFKWKNYSFVLHIQSLLWWITNTFFDLNLIDSAKGLLNLEFYLIFQVFLPPQMTNLEINSNFVESKHYITATW